MIPNKPCMSPVSPRKETYISLKRDLLTLAERSKAIVAVEMARLAPSPRDHILELLRDLLV